MLSMLQNWKGPVEVNGTRYDSIHDVKPCMFTDLALNIKLISNTTNFLQKFHQGYGNEDVVEDKVKEYRITVKPYMTKPTEPGSDFDFMAKWNNDKPMPMRTMTGIIVKETRGMVRMKLHGVGEPVITCMRCGKKLTNPVSRHYGIGPECMSKLGIIADIEDVESIKKQLVDIEWEGWIIKSAILEQEEVA